MKKKFLCSLTLALTLSATMFTGCGKPSESLSKALSNTTNMSSFESTSSLSIKIDGNEQAKMMNLSEFGFTAKSKVINEKNKKQALASDISFKYGGMSVDTSLFTESLFENNKWNSKFVMTIPPILLDLFNSFGQGAGGTSPINANTKYFFMDTKDIEKTMGKEMSEEEYKKATQQLQNLTNSLEKAINKYVSTVGKENVMKQGKKEIVVNGSNEKSTVYEIKITDKQFKDFIRRYVNDAENDKDLQKFLEAFSSKETSQINFKEKIDEFNKEFDKLPQIIGDKGLNLTLAVKDDFVIQETFETELLLSNLDNGTDAAASLGKVTLKYTTDIFNINDKGIKVELPKVDNTNSVNLIDLANMK